MNGKYWDRAWSLVDGCTPCSPGCDNCWSAAMAHRFKVEGEPGQRNGVITNEKGQFDGTVIPRYDRLNIPLKRKKPTIWSIWNDLFHEDVPDDFINNVSRIMADTVDRHVFLILTKRPERIRPYQLRNTQDFRPNVWLGTTVENQETANSRIPELLKCPGNKFLSIEPMLGPIDIQKYLPCPNQDPLLCRNWSGTCCQCDINRESNEGIDAVVLGGETGPHARPMHPDWVRSVRDQCETAGVPFFFKQWGEWEPIGPVFGDLSDIEEGRSANEFGRREIIDCFGTIWPPTMQPSPGSFVVERVGSKRAGRLLDGREHNDLPWRLPL